MTEQYSDPLDLGAELAQRERDENIKTISRRVRPIPESNYCLQCDQETEHGKRWCNKHCRDDWAPWNPQA